MPTLSPLRSHETFDDPPRSTFLGDLLFPLPAHRRTGLGILTWWESRRLLYNVVVGATGLMSLAFIQLISFIPPRLPHFVPGWEPIVIYGVLANVCFTFGPVLEIAAQRLWQERCAPIGPALFRQGLSFSVGLTLLPIFVASVSWVVHTGMLLFFSK